MDRTRRSFLQRAALFSGGLFAARRVAAGQQDQHTGHEQMPMPPGMQMDHSRMQMGEASNRTSAEGAGSIPVVTPDIADLPFELDNGVKVFHLVAEPVKREIFPGRVIDLWGYNGTAPGPTIQVNQGDRVRVIVDNHLPEATSVHWHGFEIPIEMDGVPGISQDPIAPGGRFVYEFTLHQQGTFFYHSHMPMQEMLGMIGFFIMHPKQAYQPRVVKDFGLILQEYAILPNNSVPNTLSMEFNWLTMNGKAGPATTPMIVRLGDRVRIRLVNLGMDHHPIHLHGNTFYVTGTEGGRAPQSTWAPANTVIVGVAQAREIEFDAKYVGDWMLHCHMPHHMMNQMASMVGPMTEAGHGLHAGMSMENGMGMLGQGHALSQEFGPSLGRAIGIGADFEKPTTNMPLAKQAQQAPTSAAMPGMQHDMPGMQHGTETGQTPGKLVPGYPQDMLVVMDEAVEKPQTYGLRKGWTAAMMGMMTLVRVLPPDLYDKVTSLIGEAPNNKPQGTPPAPVHQHDG